MICVTRSSTHRLTAIAAEAGCHVMRFYGNCGPVVDKSPGNPVTAADRAAHDHIVAALREWDPDVPIISEEGQLPAYAERRAWRQFWLVDPLDGTKEFIAQNGEFTVNIALIEDGEPILGVVTAPALGEQDSAARGCGSWRQAGGLPPGRLDGLVPAGDALRIVESRSHPAPELESFIATLGAVERVQLGSSLKFCRVAAGEAHLYPRFGRTMEWDVAAGDCVFRFSSPDGLARPSPLRYNQESLSTARFLIGGTAKWSICL